MSKLLRDVTAAFGGGTMGREAFGTIVLFVFVWWMLGQSVTIR